MTYFVIAHNFNCNPKLILVELICELQRTDISVELIPFWYLVCVHSTPRQFSSVFLILCLLEYILDKRFFPWIGKWNHIDWQVENLRQFIAYFWVDYKSCVSPYRRSVKFQSHLILFLFCQFLFLLVMRNYLETNTDIKQVLIALWYVYGLEPHLHIFNLFS